MSAYESASGLLRRPTSVPLKLTAPRLIAANATSFHVDANMANSANAIAVTAFPNSIVLLTANGANTSAALPPAANLIVQLQSVGYKVGDTATVKLINTGTNANTVILANGTNTLIRSGGISLAAGAARDIVLVYANSTNVDVY